MNSSEVRSMAEAIRAALGRINVGSVVLGSVLLIAPKELRKQAFWYTNVTKMTKRYDGAVLALGVGLVGAITRNDLLQRALVWGLAVTVKSIYDDVVAKEPFVLVQSGQVEGWNFDPNENVALYIDGAPIRETVTTDANGYFKYTPASPLASGTHTVVAATSKKAYYETVAI
jgi:hypothetical protein